MASADFRDKLLAALGGTWPNPCPLNVKQRKVIPRDGFTIHSLTFDAQPHDPIPAMLLIPDGVSAKNPAPAVAVWHQHNGQYQIGKSEPAGQAGNPMHHTGAALAKEGYVVLCIDALCFEERQDPDKKLRRGNYERFMFLDYVVDGKCLEWKDILDMKRAVDFLVSRPEVLADRIGCYGHSMGSTHTWMVGPWEPRLKCLIGNCCLPTYAGIRREKMLHCFENFIPGIHQYGDIPDIAALIAPRALHLNFGELDRGTPIEDVPDSIRTISRVYASMHAEKKFTHYIEKGSGHILSKEMWKRTKETFAKYLKARR